MAENSSQPGLDALLNNVAFAPIHNVGWIRVTGGDRVRWLNGMATNSIQALTSGKGCYNFFLNAQGRIQGDAVAWMREDAILLQTAVDRIGPLIAYLDRFIIMDDVALEDHSADGTGVALLGPQAQGLLTKLGFPADLPPLHLQELLWPAPQGSVVVRCLSLSSPLVPRFELWSDPATIRHILDTFRYGGVAEATPADLEALRILEGAPLFGVDIRDKDLPQETNQTRALHFSKGCYLGQEIVERIRSRGAVHRTFHGFVLKGDEAKPGTSLFTTDPAKPVGELTSVARIGTLTLALGYIRREALDTKALISYAGGSAEPTLLPYPHPIS